jgi:ubiquinone/menaquinone biosynthesis C-methylase UbiE
MNNIARKKIIQAYYSKRFKDYDRQKSRTWRSSQGFGVKVINEVLGALTGFDAKLVLEVGVGSGRNALPLLERVRPQFVGLGLSREMLELAKAKMPSFRQNFDLILGDAKHLPFMNQIFDAIICMSTMHYFTSQERMLERFSESVKEKGMFVYGDLTLHELDNQGFLEKSERTLSKARARYYKPSETRTLIETQGFHISKTRTVPYKKLHSSLMEDKGEDFSIAPQALCDCIAGATVEAREQYDLTSTGLTLFYTIVTAQKKD